MEITTQILREWRRKEGLTQTELGEVLGLDKSAIAKIENGFRRISGPEQKLLAGYIYGQNPLALPEKQDDRLQFSDDEWETIAAMARRDGYANPREWVVDRVKTYIRMSGGETLSSRVRDEMLPAHQSNKRPPKKTAKKAG